MKSTNASAMQIFMVMIFLLVFAFVGFFYLKGKRLESSTADVPAEKTCADLNLVGLDQTRFDSSVFAQGVYLLLFFKNDCMSCNPNLSAWKNLADYLGSQIHILGILPGGNPVSTQFQTERNLNFPIYLSTGGPAVPLLLGIDTRIENTVVVHNNNILFSKPGVLTGRDLNALITMIKDIIKKK